MSLKIFKDGKVIVEAVDDRAFFIPTYESEKTKDPSVFNLTEKDRIGEGGLTRK